MQVETGSGSIQPSYTPTLADVAPARPSVASRALLTQLTDCRSAVRTALADDFDTPTALHQLSALVAAAGAYAQNQMAASASASASSSNSSSTSSSEFSSGSASCLLEPIEPLISTRDYCLWLMHSLGVNLHVSSTGFSKGSVSCGVGVGLAGGTELREEMLADAIVSFRQEVL